MLNSSGALTVQGDATIGISNRNDGSGGGTTAGGAIVTILAKSIAVKGVLDGFVTANGGQIGGTGAVVFNVAGDIHAGAGIFFKPKAMPTMAAAALYAQLDRRGRDY